MKVKRIVLSVLLLIPSVIFGIESSDGGIIPNSSYYIIKGNERTIQGGISAASEYVTYYDSDVKMNTK